MKENFFKFSLIFSNLNNINYTSKQYQILQKQKVLLLHHVGSQKPLMVKTILLLKKETNYKNISKFELYCFLKNLIKDMFSESYAK